MSKRAKPPSSRRPDELDEFKRRVNLTEYAATLGYAIDRRASSRNSATMRHPAGDKVIVAKGEDGHWVYFSVHDPADSGSIIDFIQRRESGTLGDVRKQLRPWVGGTPLPDFKRPPPESYAADLDPIRRDLIGVRLKYETTRPIDGQHKYLEETRGIPPHILTDPLFADRIRVDDHGNAVFPHYNREGLCGFELKNKGFTGFASGGTKGLWFSKIGPADSRLVVAETAIDALSYAAMHHRSGTRYLSTAGELNPDQPILLRQAMEKLPDGGQVVLALDNDDGGNKIGAKIEAVFGMVGRPGLALAYDRPRIVGKDWNDVLRGPAAPGHAEPSLRPRPPR